MQSKTNRHVAMCTAYFPPHTGGIERYVLNISRELIRRGWEVSILTTLLPETSLHEEYEGMQIHRIPSVPLADGRLPLPKIWRGDVRAQLAAFRKTAPDIFVIHTYLFPLTLLGAILGRRKKRPVVTIGHGSGHIAAQGRLLGIALHGYEHLMAGLLKLFSLRFFAVSGQAEEWWQHFKIASSGTIHNGIVPESAGQQEQKAVIPGLNKDGIKIAFVARLLREKGADSAIRAFLDIAARYPQAQLVIAGDGPAAAELRELAADHPQILFSGELDHSAVLSLLDAADVFIYPSRYPEGLPTCILEAGLMKCAVIATPAGGVREIIPSEEFGTVVSTPAGLSAALVEVLENDARRKEQAENLHARVITKFSWETIATTLETEMDRIMGAKHCKR